MVADSSYCASKFAVRGLTQVAGTLFTEIHALQYSPADGVLFIARELGKYGITVNAYAPGGVKTAMGQLLYLDTSHPRRNAFFPQSTR
jgi:NAD(P)-dependent dehydrogenase (short-subunit alcohol dehydrogenase family)